MGVKAWQAETVGGSKVSKMDENKRKNCKKECEWLCITVTVTLILVCIVYKIWQRDFTCPIVYNGDGVGALQTIKNIVEGNGFWNMPNYAAPFGENNNVQDYLLPMIIIQFIALFVKEVGVVANIFWLLTYVMTAITAYAFLRRLSIKPEVSLLGSVIYNFLPYHFFRIPHFWLFGCYVIPLAGWVILDLMEERLLFKWDEKDEKIRINYTRVILDIILCLIVGLNGIYYAIFTIILLGVLGIYMTIDYKRARYLLIMAGYIMAVFTPILLFWFGRGMSDGGTVMKAMAESRNETQIDVYGLKIFLLFFPIPGHRIPLLSQFTDFYYEKLGIYTENFTASLGLLMSVGLIVTLMSLFCKNLFNKNTEIMQKLGKVNTLILFISTIGGFDNFIAIFLSSSVRCYNRMSVFIALFSISAVCILINTFFEKKNNGFFSKMVFISILICVGVFDQTSEKFSEYSTYNIEKKEYQAAYAENEKTYKDNRDYFKHIEGQLDEEKMIYAMPDVAVYVEGKESFQKAKGLINTSGNVRWSLSSWDFRYKQWLDTIEKSGTENFLKMLSIAGFSGIVIDKNSYADYNAFYDNVAAIEKLCKTEAYVSSDRNLYFYDIREFKENFLSSYDENERKELKKGLEYLVYVDQVQMEQLKADGKEGKTEIKLDRDEVQFGPYIDLEAGKYKVSVIGKNLDKASVWMTSKAGKKNIAISNITIDDQCITYEFKIKELEEDVEFLLRAGQDETVIEDYFYELKRYTDYHDASDAAKALENLNRAVDISYIVYPVQIGELWKDGKQIGSSCNSILLNKNELQYGPYATLQSGYYKITVEGDKLRDTEVWVTSDGGKKAIPIKRVVHTESSISYEFQIDREYSAVEFLLKSKNSGTVIQSYTCERNDEEFHFYYEAKE